MKAIRANRPSAADDLGRAIILHVCKDGTVSYRRPPEPVFNGVALPVFSVDSVEHAEAIQVRFCRAMWCEHPKMPGRIWYKLSKLGDGTDPAFRGDGTLDLEDLNGIADMFRAFYAEHLAP